MLVVCMQPEFHSMVPVKAGKLETLQQGALCWPSSLKQCIAVCNSLNLVNRHDLVGDLADYTAFKACEARFVVCLITSKFSSKGHAALDRPPVCLLCGLPPLQLADVMASRVLCCAV